MSNLRELIVKNEAKISEALPRGVKFDRLVSLALSCARKNPTLMKCDQSSFLSAMIQISYLGLEPGITAHLVPFYNKKEKRMEVQYIPDYRGLMQLARRSGEVVSIEAACVYDGDFFEFEKGSEQYLRHTQTFSSEDDKDITHVWALARFKDGTYQFEVMSSEGIERLRDRSKVSDKGPWGTDFPEMAKKSVVRRLCKYLPSSTELQAAVIADEIAERGQAQPIVVDVEPGQAQKSLADKIRDKKGDTGEVAGEDAGEEAA